MYYIYIIKCSGNAFYTGITSNVSRRMHEHFNKTEKCAKYTRSHNAEKLVALWTTDTRKNASKLEWHIKQLTHTQKVQLINNPESVNSIIKNSESTCIFTTVNADLDSFTQ